LYNTETIALEESLKSTTEILKTFKRNRKTLRNLQKIFENNYLCAKALRIIHYVPIIMPRHITGISRETSFYRQGIKSFPSLHITLPYTLKHFEVPTSSLAPAENISRQMMERLYRKISKFSSNNVLYFLQ
jgi:hypothetical protein